MLNDLPNGLNTFLSTLTRSKGVLGVFPSATPVMCCEQLRSAAKGQHSLNYSVLLELYMKLKVTAGGD